MLVLIILELFCFTPTVLTIDEPLNGNRITISYNNWGKFWGMKNASKIEMGTYEGYLMESFIQKYKLKATYLNANFKWGSLDKKSKLWNGGVGNVS